MKKVLFISVFTLFTFAVFAQKKSGVANPVSFSVGIESGIPLDGTFAETYATGWGGSAQLDYKFRKNLAATFYTGLSSFNGKTVNGVKVDPLNIIPVLAGLKYSFSDKVYGSAQAGVTFESGSGSGTNFTYAPGLGYHFTPQVDLLVKYVGINAKSLNQNTIGLRLAYNF